MRLTSTAGLHAIETGNFADYPREDTRGQMSGRRASSRPITSLAPPRDPVELGERIWAWWTAFCKSHPLASSSRFGRSSLQADEPSCSGAMIASDLDRGGSGSTGWPEAIADKEIVTPLPRPMEHYESDGHTVLPERHLSDLFSVASPPPSRPDGVGAVLIQALALHHRISRIGCHPSIRTAHRATAPSVSSPASAPTAPDPISFPPAFPSLSAEPARDRTPGPIPQVLFDEELLLQKFVTSMPPSATTLQGPGGIPAYNVSRTLSTDQGGLDLASSTETYGVHPIVFSLNTILYTAFMLLYEEMAEFEGTGTGDEYEEKACQAGVAAVSMIGSIIDIDFGELDRTYPFDLWVRTPGELG